MEVAQQLESYCQDLESKTITKRKKACEDLLQIIRNKTTIDCLNNGTVITWKHLLNAIEKCLIKEGEKKTEDFRKKGNNITWGHPVCDVLSEYIRVIIKNDVPLDFNDFIRFIIENLETETFQKCYKNIFLSILNESLLKYWKCLCNIPENLWIDLFSFIKLLCVGNSGNDFIQIETLHLIIKWGPQYKFPFDLLKSQFEFITKLGLDIKRNSPKLQQEITVEILHDFCLFLASDCRDACCKLGEDVIPTIMELYGLHGRSDRIKTQITDFLLLQLTLHNPYCIDNNNTATAVVPTQNFIFSTLIQRIYNLLSDEIKWNLNTTNKNSMFFILNKNNDSMEISENFTELFVGVAHHCFNTVTAPSPSPLTTQFPRSAFMLNGGDDPCDRPPPKRLRVETNFQSLVEKIEETKFWGWIWLAGSYLETYSTATSPEHRNNLLKIAANFLIDVKDPDLRSHLCRLINILGQITPQHNHEIWGTISKLALNLISLNQNDYYSQKLLQFLIQKNQIDLENFFKICQSLKMNPRNLDTINIALQHSSEIEKNIKKDLIIWIFKNIPENNTNVDFTKNIGETLRYLTLKQYPTNTSLPTTKQSHHQIYQKIYKLFRYENFDQLFNNITEKSTENRENPKNYLDLEIFEFVGKQLQELTIKQRHYFLTIPIIQMIIISYLDNHQLLSDTEKQLNLEETIQNYSVNLIKDYTIETIDENSQKQLIVAIKQLNVLLNIRQSEWCTIKLREFIPKGLLQLIFQIMGIDELDEELQMILLKCLTNFSFIPGNSQENYNEFQLRAISALLKRDTYDFTKLSDYRLIMNFLNYWKECAPKFLPQELLLGIFNLFSDLCENWFRGATVAMELLNLFYEIFPMFCPLGKSSMVSILYVFFQNKNDYGPDVQMALINCMRVTYEVSRDQEPYLWEEKEVVIWITEFLKSPYQAVRFCAIENLAKFYQISSVDITLDDYNRQRTVLSEIKSMITEISKIDNYKTLAHIAATIIITAHIWLEDALYILVNLSKFILHDIIKILELITIELQFDDSESFLIQYLPKLYGKWVLTSSDNNTFFYEIYQFPNYNQFIENNYLLIPYLAFKHDPETFQKFPVETLIDDEILPNIFSNILVAYAGNNFNNFRSDRLISYLDRTFRANSHELSINIRRFSDRLLNKLLEFVVDETDFEKKFDTKIYFSKFSSYRIDHRTLTRIIEYVESYLDNCDLIKEIIENPFNTNWLILQLKLKIYHSKIPIVKYRYFHHFCIVLDLFVSKLTSTYRYSQWLIQLLITTFLNFLIDTSIRKFQEIVLNSFDTFIKQTLHNFHDIYQESFSNIVSVLKKLSTDHSKSLSILQYLIIENRSIFEQNIEQLEDFPENLEKLYRIHHEIKYKNKVTLKDEIEQFIRFDTCDSDTIRHIRTLINEHKNEFWELCDYNQQIKRLFSEDSHQNLLHNLIYKLIKSIGLESIRCLGEIGPFDLRFLILKPETSGESNLNLTTEQLLLQFLLTESINYLNHSNVILVQNINSLLSQLFKYTDVKNLLKNFEQIDMLSYTPFLMLQTQGVANYRRNSDFDEIPMIIEWISGVSYESWLKNLTKKLLGILHDAPILRPICELEINYAEKLVPYVLLFCLENSKKATNVISERFSLFFENHWQNGTEITMNKKAVNFMLNCVDFLRIECSRRKLSNNLQLNYLYIAKAADYCELHVIALYYAEIWCKQKLFDNINDFSRSGITELDIIHEMVDSTESKALHYIFQKAYKSIGEIDAFLGCGSSLLLHPELRMEYYKSQNKHQQVIQYYENSLNHSAGSSGLLSDSLKQLNMYNLALYSSESNQQIDYECLWRLSQWNHHNRTNETNVNQYEKLKFHAIKAMHDRDYFVLNRSLDSLRSIIIENYRNCNFNISQKFYGLLMQSQALKELEDFAQVYEYENREDLEKLLKKWLNDSNRHSFEYIEPIRSQRIVLLKMLSEKNDDFRQDLYRMQLQLASYARKEDQVSCANRIIIELRQNFDRLDEELKAEFQIEEAELCWKIQDAVTAKVILRQLCSDENIDLRLHGLALKMTGKWLVESSSENRQTIIDNYFKKSIDLFETTNVFGKNNQLIVDTFWDLAKFADKEYQRVMSHIKSDDFQKNLEHAQKTKRYLESITDLRKLTKDECRSVTIRQRLCKLDFVEIQDIESKRDQLLQLALEYYMRVLKQSDEHDISIFRIISLILQNRKNTECQRIGETHLPALPTYKFIQILPQISPHISNNSPDWVSKLINDILVKCAIEHPHHTLPFILTLAYAKKDQKYSKSSTTNDITDARIDSAQDLLKIIRKKGGKSMGKLIDQMELLWEGFIQLAYYVEVDDDKSSAMIPRNFMIRQVKNYDEVLLPIVDLPVDKTQNYKNSLVGITEIAARFDFVGGINAPKRLSCTGTDGSKRSLLVKGQDDMRQDAVMQQVFTILNNLLACNKETKNLLIRTYKVVPLSRVSGVLQWVDNSLTLSEYLLGSKSRKGAHDLYRPHDMSPRDCKRDFSSVSKDTPERRLRVFKKICSRFQPIFHKFFETNFLDPIMWYERRRAFTHSVAATSIIGYILGIGDRHLNNILIDKVTAEVIHIDFGIAFEQGKALPTPETVPFRLTRDIVDGMGVSGIEGVFRKSCEKTMEVLRKNYQTITSILEVLLYDPLYMWTVSKSEANRRQRDRDDVDDVTLADNSDESDSDINMTAERALIRLQAKLLGTDQGSPMTVEHQVGTLIQQAMDPMNLCRLYFGWQPYF